MNSGCKKVEERLIDFVEKTLPDIQKAEIKDHIQSCADCDRLVREFYTIWQRISTRERKAPSRSFWPMLIQRIQTDEKPQQFWENIVVGFKRSLRPAVVSLFLLVGAYLGYHLGYVPVDTGKLISGEEYFVEYLEEFQDVPLGSAGDFYLSYSTTEQGEIP
ncbi:zf-HC2 domain-containing protein [Acidobacteriota bacterium]